MNSKQMKQAMKKMGMQQVDIDAVEVIIRTPQKEIVLAQPSVQKVNMMGQWSYQISGEETERAVNTTPDINDDDVQTVMEQTNCTQEEAKKAIDEAKGDLAEAILNLTED